MLVVLCPSQGARSARRALVDLVGNPEKKTGPLTRLPLGEQNMECMPHRRPGRRAGLVCPNVSLPPNPRSMLPRAPQAEGKKRMKALGKVEVPQEAFMAVLKIDREASD